MCRPKLCLSLNRNYSPSYEEQIKLLRKAGFDGFFVVKGSSVPLHSVFCVLSGRLFIINFRW